MIHRPGHYGHTDQFQIEIYSYMRSSKGHMTDYYVELGIENNSRCRDVQKETFAQITH
jgi:hypothetical protein